MIDEKRYEFCPENCEKRTWSSYKYIGCDEVVKKYCINGSVCRNLYNHLKDNMDIKTLNKANELLKEIKEKRVNIYRLERAIKQGEYGQKNYCIMANGDFVCKLDLSFIKNEYKKQEDELLELEKQFEEL